ncbi:uncharacterized protein B0T23DRAFT_371367 [Neurospora hispaniola]|uniref:Uncharacterized protein n=1 Tax=Neurospora hispaniola TaxID=588809 RepID=A0AAJ0MVS3_9PEZI|nr:hypothetical protein B0T23DRAFT_371367 [Neurospora hispaniola]
MGVSSWMIILCLSELNETDTDRIHHLLFLAKKATGTYRPINHRTAMLLCCHDADPRTRRCHDARGRDTMVGTLDAVLTINRERSSVLRRSRFCAVETMVDVVDGGDGG